MEFKFDNNYPIHLQLVEQLSFYIVSGYLKPTEKLPSVREIASMAEVNHNTIQKALNEIEALGLIITNRTNGKFVTEDIDTINRVRDSIIKNKTSMFLKDIENIGVYSIKIEIQKDEKKEKEIYEYTRMS